MFDILTSEPARPQQDSATALAPPAIQAERPTVTVTAGETAINNLTWQDVDATAGNPVQLIGMVLGAGSITNVSDLSLTSGTAQWVLNGATTEHAGVIVVRILDNDNLVGFAQFNLVVNDPPPNNVLPTIAVRDETVPVNVGETVTNIFDWTDGDATILKPVSFQIVGQLPGESLSWSPETQPSGTVTYTFSNAQIANDNGRTVRVRITDADGATADDTFTITVNSSNTAPTVAFDDGDTKDLSPPTGAEAIITGTWSDAETSAVNPLTSVVATINGTVIGPGAGEIPGSVTVTPPGMDATNGTFSVSITSPEIGFDNQNLVVTVTDGDGGFGSDSIRLRWPFVDALKQATGHPDNANSGSFGESTPWELVANNSFEPRPAWLPKNGAWDGGLTANTTPWTFDYNDLTHDYHIGLRAWIPSGSSLTIRRLVDGVQQTTDTITTTTIPPAGLQGKNRPSVDATGFTWDDTFEAVAGTFVQLEVTGTDGGNGFPFLVSSDFEILATTPSNTITVPSTTTTINDPVTTYSETLGKGIQNHKNIELRDLISTTPSGLKNSVVFSIDSSTGNASGGGTTEMLDDHILAYQVTDSGTSAGIQTVVVRASLAGADDKTFTVDLVNVAGIFCRPDANDTNPGTWSSPKRTIEAATNDAGNGVNVWAHPGIYNEDPTNDLRFMPLFINGKNDMEIRPLEDAGTAVISGNEPGGNEFGITANYFDGAGGQDQGWAVTAHGLVFITNSKRITLDGFEIRNSNMAGVSVHNETVRPSAGNWCEDIVIRRNYIHHTRTQGIAVRGQDILANGSVPKLSNITVIDNILDMVNLSALEGPSDWRAPANQAETNAINSFSGGGEGLTVSKISGFTVAGNIITNYHREGSSFNSVDNGVISYNLWHTHVWNKYYPKSGRGTGLYLDSNELGMQDVDVHHNASIRNTNTAMAMNTEAQEGVNEGFDRVRVWNNLFLDSFNHGEGGSFTEPTRRRRSIEFAGSAGASAGPEPLRNVEIFHNILEGDIVMAGYSQAQFNLWTNFRLVNNIFYRNVFSTTRLINLSGISFSGTHTVDNNSFYNGGGTLINITTNHGTNRITSNPNMLSLTRAMERDRQLPAFGWPERQVDYDRPQTHFDASGLIAIPGNIDFFNSTRQAPNPSVGAINVAASASGNAVVNAFAIGTSLILAGTYTAISTSTPATGELVTDIQYTITVTDAGNPNDGRVIVVAGAPGVKPTVQSDTGGTPANRLTDAMINGVSENWNFDVTAADVVTVDADAAVVTSLQVTDSGPNVVVQPII